VYQDEDAPATERDGSGVYRAFSGSVEAAGTSESEALETLDRNLARLSSRPSADTATDAEQPERATLADTDLCPPRFQSILPPTRDGEPDTVRAPRHSSVPALAFARRD
jgi:hypothetical protein